MKPTKRLNKMKQIEQVVDYCLQHTELLGLEMGVTRTSIDKLKKQGYNIAKEGTPVGWEIDLLNKRWVVSFFPSEDLKEKYFCVYEAYPRQSKYSDMVFRKEKFKGIVTV